MIFGRSGPVRTLDNDSFRSFGTRNCVLYSNHQFSSIASEVLYFFLINQWRLVDILPSTLLSSSYCLLLQYFSSSFGVFSSTFLLHSVGLLNSMLIASNEVFGSVLKKLVRIVRCCVAERLHDVSTKMKFTYMAHNALDCIFEQRVSELFFRRLSFSVSTSSSHFSTSSFGSNTIGRAAHFANGTSVDRSIETVFQISSSWIVIFVSDTSNSLRGPILRGISLL